MAISLRYASISKKSGTLYSIPPVEAFVANVNPCSNVLGFNQQDAKVRNNRLSISSVTLPPYCTSAYRKKKEDGNGGRFF